MVSHYLNGKENMKKINSLKALFVVLPLLASCSLDFKKIEKKAALINHYEKVSLKLESKNRELITEIHNLKAEIDKLKQKNLSALSSQHEKKEVDKTEDPHHHEADNHHLDQNRKIASVSPAEVNKDEKKDFVEFETYKWKAVDLMKIADTEFKDKHYDKAAQFYTSVLNNYPNDKNITDKFYFKGGIASFESGIHNDWSLQHFGALMTKYPTSQYFRSSKLWVALTHMKMGDKKIFYETVEEFRKKYRNTHEWQVLSTYYENIKANSDKETSIKEKKNE